MFQIQGGAYFRADLKCLAHFFVRCFIALQNFKKFGWVYKPFKNVFRIYVFPNKNPFSQEKF